MIPKTIHYCWFGGNPLPKLAKKCIKSWKKYAKDYEIIEWNESTYDLAAAPLYVRQAYEAKKWAFVTDYVRLQVIYEYGGIYMDTDVELTGKMEPFLVHEAFSGFESANYVPTGLMAGEKGNALYAELLQYYDDRPFVREDGTYDTKTNTKIITETMVEKGLRLDNTFQTIEGFSFYPSDYFCPLDAGTGLLSKTKNTVAIHHFNGSWLPKEDTERRKKWWRKMRWEHLRYAPNRFLIRTLGEERYQKLKRLLGKA